MAENKKASTMADLNEQHNNKQIAKDCQVEAYITRPMNRQDLILKVLGEREMTARQLAYEMGYSDLNAVKPRLTELIKQGKVKRVGKALDELTGRNTSIYKVV